MKPPRNEVRFPDSPVESTGGTSGDDVAATREAPAPAAGADAPTAARPWLPIDDTTPRDGTLIEYKVHPEDADASAGHARWRMTRQRDASNRRWVPVGFWSDPITREGLRAEPAVWRMPEGYAMPGMVV